MRRSIVLKLKFKTTIKATVFTNKNVKVKKKVVIIYVEVV